VQTGGVRTLYVIGMGAGDPEHITVAAVAALNRLDVVLVLDKGEVKAELVELREQMLARYVEGPAPRVAHGRDPERDRTPASGDPVAYAAAVEDWRRRRADVVEGLLLEELADGQVGGVLVWGDPALYDSTIGIVEDVAARGSVELDWHVVPGVSSVSALVARHRTGLNQVGGAVQVTTGRRLRAGLPPGVDDVVVMLDAHGEFAALEEDGLHIYWGAYVGTPDEILVAGPLAEVRQQILDAREQARARKGWIMDSYLLRRTSARGGAAPDGG
jgi:precorrin-6A synthase